MRYNLPYNRGREAEKMRPAVLLVCLLAVSRSTFAQQAFTIGPMTVPPARVAYTSLDVAAKAGDSGTTIPISVINGAAPGPVLALIAGTHGMEYVPIVALQRLRAR